SVSVASIAKKKLSAGSFISKGTGSMEIRGEAITIGQQPDHVPVGLMSQVHIKRAIEPGQIITFDDVDLPESMALDAWMATLQNLAVPPARMDAILQTA